MIGTGSDQSGGDHMERSTTLPVGLGSWLPVMFLAVVLSGCVTDSGHEDPFLEFDPYDESKGARVTEYFSTVSGTAALRPQGPPSIYVDFSSGMIQAYTSNEANGAVMEAVGQKFVDPAITWFKLGNDSIKPLNELKNDKLYNLVTDKSKYGKETVAPLQRALERIVSEPKEALLITDFEEYTPDRTEQLLGYGKDHFKKWLLAGNKLTLFSNKYFEKTKDGRQVQKRLNFMVFSIGQGAANGLLEQFEKAILGKTMDSRFDLTNGAFTVVPDYPKEGVGGIWRNPDAADEEGQNVFEMDGAAYVNGFAAHGTPFEFYPLDGLPWSYVDKTRLGEDKMAHFLRNLFLNASNTSSYALKEMAVEVYDVTADYEHFARCMEVAKHVPKVVKDPDHGYLRFADDEEDPIALVCYDSTGTIKPEWVYAPKERPVLKEVFSLAEELFNTKLRTDPAKVELAIDFHPEFDASKLTAARMVRVDLVVKGTQDASQDATLDAMIWTSAIKRDRENKSLYYSIRETLQDPAIAPERSHPVLYSYFILVAATK